MSNTHRQIEEVLGSELKVGDIVFVEGFRWEITEVDFDPRGNTGSQPRYLAKLKYAPRDPGSREDKLAREVLGNFADNMTSGLRIDLRWLREVAQ